MHLIIFLLVLVIWLVIRNIFCENQSQILEIITLNVADYIFYDVVDYVFMIT